MARKCGTKSGTKVAYKTVERREKKQTQLGEFPSGANPFLFDDIGSADPTIYEKFCETVDDCITVKNSCSIVSKYIAERRKRRSILLSLRARDFYILHFNFYINSAFCIISKAKHPDGFKKPSGCTFYYSSSGG